MCEAYDAVMKHLKYGDFYLEVEMSSGQITWPIFNSLTAFWPSVQGEAMRKRMIHFFIEIWEPEVPKFQ